MKTNHRSLGYALAFLLLLPEARGQENAVVDPPELIAKREEHLRALQRVTLPELQAYAARLTVLKQQYAREAKLEAGLAVDRELREVAGQIQLAQEAANVTKTAVQQLTLTSVEYGHFASKRTVKVERILRQALAAGQATILLNHAVLNSGRDPAPYAPKETVIKYISAGQKKEKAFREGHLLDFKADLQ